MNRGTRAFSLGLTAIALVGLGVSGSVFVGRGAAQEAAGNQGGEVVAAPPPAAAPNTAPPSLAAAPPPEAAPTVAPPASADANVDSNEASDGDAAAPPPPAPLVRLRYTTAVLQALDKVTAETLRFEAKVGEPVRYKDLVITVHDCETSAPNEAPPNNVPGDSIVHMDVQYQPAVLSGGAAAGRQVFQGWMFAESPGLHPFANPIYDVWAIACKTPIPPVAAAPPAPAPAPGAPTPAKGGASL